MRRFLIAACLGLLAAPAAAQQLGARIPGQGEPGMARQSAAAQGAARPCPEYGPGFVRLNGSNVCVRLSGMVRFEYGVGTGRSHGASSGTRSGATVELDARTQTEMGQLRAVVRGGGAVESGVMRGQRW